ncbi:hypothetical protein [Sorangium sp. So ce1151]|uniref:hypothetical protein n=1 Tax=Sorangium sp. So ce1151 TaxID=3133332 RepID=UPI003F648721
MTLCTPLPRKNPPWEISAVAPAPTMVLFDATEISLPLGDIVIFPWTRITWGPDAPAYRSRSAWFVTVTVSPPRPPSVPSWPSPLTLAKPSRVRGQPSLSTVPPVPPAPPPPGPPGPALD